MPRKLKKRKDINMRIPEYRVPYERILSYMYPPINEGGTGSCSRVPIDHDPKKTSTGGMEAAMGKSKEKMEEE
jgi:hypothetical protein